MTFRPAVKHLSLPEEVQAKWQEAREKWEARKVQVLIEDDELPENATNVLELERLQTVLENAPAPSRVYVDGKVYKVKLRKRVSREEYKALMGELAKYLRDLIFKGR